MAEVSTIVGGTAVEESAEDRQVLVDESGQEQGVTGPGGRLMRWGQRGMVSAEWAVGLVAAMAIAGVLIAIVTHGTVKTALLGFIVEVIAAFSGFIANGS